MSHVPGFYEVPEQVSRVEAAVGALKIEEIMKLTSQIYSYDHVKILRPLHMCQMVNPQP